MEIALGIGIGIVAATLAYLAGRYGLPGKGRGGDVGELEETVISLQRSVKLLQGRMNTFAPPRLGTGETPLQDAPGSTIDTSDEGSPRQRILRAYRAQIAMKGGRR